MTLNKTRESFKFNSFLNNIHARTIYYCEVLGKNIILTAIATHTFHTHNVYLTASKSHDRSLKGITLFFIHYFVCLLYFFVILCIYLKYFFSSFIDALKNAKKGIIKSFSTLQAVRAPRDHRERKAPMADPDPRDLPEAQ